jgi:hypothetical protein
MQAGNSVIVVCMRRFLCFQMLIVIVCASLALAALIFHQYYHRYISPNSIAMHGMRDLHSRIISHMQIAPEDGYCLLSLTNLVLKGVLTHKDVEFLNKYNIDYIEPIDSAPPESVVFIKRTRYLEIFVTKEGTLVKREKTNEGIDEKGVGPFE